MPYYAGRMLASKIAYYARNSAGRIYPSLLYTTHNACSVQNLPHMRFKKPEAAKVASGF